MVVRAIKIIEIPKINAIIVAIEWALSISFHLNKASIPKNPPIEILVCRIVNKPISASRINFVIDDNKLSIENPKISTTPANNNKFLV